jgi:hypothetical protein
VKSLSWLVGAGTLLGTGAYLFVYVYRWEWHRALLVGVLFLACLLVLATAVLLRRLNRLERRVVGAPAAHDDAELVRQRLREAPLRTRPFPWLAPEALERTHVFIPILLGGGVIVSAIAWIVERLAGSSARAGVEAELADELAAVAYPDMPLVPSDAELLAADKAGTPDPRLQLLLGPRGTT